MGPRQDSVSLGGEEGPQGFCPIGVFAPSLGLFHIYECGMETIPCPRDLVLTTVCFVV